MGQLTDRRLRPQRGRTPVIRNQIAVPVAVAWYGPNLMEARLRPLLCYRGQPQQVVIQESQQRDLRVDLRSKLGSGRMMSTGTVYFW